MSSQPENFSRHCRSPSPSLEGSSRPHRRHPSPPSIGSANGQRLRLIPSPPHPYVRRRGPPNGIPFYHRFSHHGIEGVSLASVRRSDEFMDHPNIPIMLGGQLRSKISYHFMIKGYPVFSKQQHAVRVKRGRRVPKHLRDVARQVVTLFDIFLSEHQDDPAEGADKVVFGPGGIAVEDLYLYELMQINTASVEVRLGYKPSQSHGVTGDSSQPSALPGVAAPESRNAVASSSALCGRWQVNSAGAAILTSAGRSALPPHPTHSYPILAHANPVAGDIVYPTHRHALEAAGSSHSAYEDTSSLQPNQHHGIDRRDLLASSPETASYDWFNPRAYTTTPAQTLPSDFPTPIASPPRLVPSLAGDSLHPWVYPTGVSYPEEAGFASAQPDFAPESWPLSDQAVQYDSLEAAWPFAFFHPSLGPPLPPLDDNILRGTPQIALPLFEPRTFWVQ